MLGIRNTMIILASLILVASCKKEDQGELDEAKIQEYIAANADLEASVRTESGLYYLISDSGSTDHPGITSTVVAYYTGALLDGTVFDEVVSPASPLSLPLAYAIAGWQEGIPFFGRGGKGVLLIPSGLGYGDQKTGSIPANSVLRFDIELVDFY